MLFSEHTRFSLENVIQKMPLEYTFKMHGAFRYPVYKNWKAGVQNNTDLHILYVWGGNGCYRMKDGAKIPLRKGSLVFISQQFEHTAEVDENNLLKIQGLRFGIYDRASRHITGSLIKPSYFAMEVNNFQYYDQLTHRIHQLFHSTRISESNNICSSILYQLFADMYITLTGVSFEKEYDSRIWMAKDFIDKNPLRSVNIADLAKKSDISVRYLQKKFKEQTGYTPKEYLLNVRMNIAYSYLEHESISIKEVADLLGYSDQYAFSRQFKKFFGISPSRVKHHPSIL